MIYDRALDRVDVETSDPLIATFYEMVKPNIDANYRKAVNGKKGGRPPKKKGSSDEKPEVIGHETIGSDENNHRLNNSEPNVNVNVNDNVNGTLPSNNNLRTMEVDGVLVDIDTGEEVCPFGEELH